MNPPVRGQSTLRRRLVRQSRRTNYRSVSTRAGPMGFCPVTLETARPPRLLHDGSFAVFEDTEFLGRSHIDRDECWQASIENLLRPIQLVIGDASVLKCFLKIVCGWKASHSTSGTLYPGAEGTNYT